MTLKLSKIFVDFDIAEEEDSFSQGHKIYDWYLIVDHQFLRHLSTDLWICLDTHHFISSRTKTTPLIQSLNGLMEHFNLELILV